MSSRNGAGKDAEAKRPKAADRSWREGIFGRTLGQCIDEEQGPRMHKAFAALMGVDESAISQLIQGKKEVEPKTLRRVMAGFKSLRLQEQVHAAYVREYTGPPVFETCALADAELIAQVEDLWAGALPRYALKLARARRRVTTDQAIWNSLTRWIIQLEMRLNNHGRALVEIQEMEGRAFECNDRSTMMGVKWLRGLTLQNMDHVSLNRLSDAHLQTVTFADRVAPQKGAAREVWARDRAAIERDLGLAILSHHEKHPLPSPQLQVALRFVDNSIKMTDDKAVRGIGLEARSRIEIALGHLVKAEDTLDELESQGLHEPELREKVAIDRALILARRQKCDEALDLMRKVSAYCLTQMNLHYHRVAEQLIGKILVEA